MFFSFSFVFSRDFSRSRRISHFVAAFLLLHFFFFSNSSRLAQAETVSRLERGTPFSQTEEESLMGTAMMQQLRHDGYVPSDLLVQTYLQTIGDRLSSHEPGLNPKIFAVSSEELNAFAFFGQHIAVHTGLILGVKTESQLAAILAHEMAHLKQRHLSRLLTQQKTLMPLTSAGLLGALLLGSLGNPEVGVSAATAILAGRLQHMISYTQDCEKEADRIGTILLAQAGFDPTAMQEALQGLQLTKRLDGKPPEYLITHPLYESRMADVQNRAEKLPRRQSVSSNLFELIQMRLQVDREVLPSKLIKKFRRRLETEQETKRLIVRYGYALALARDQQLLQAETILNELVQQNPKEWLLQASLAEVEQLSGKKLAALNRLKTLYKAMPRSLAVALSYAKLLLEHKESFEAEQILLEQKAIYPEEPTIYEVLAKAAHLKGQEAKTHQIKAEVHFLNGELEAALQQLDISVEKAGANPAMLKQIEGRKQFFEDFLRKTQRTKIYLNSKGKSESIAK